MSSEEPADKGTEAQQEQFTTTLRRRDFARFLAVPNAVNDEAILRVTEDGLSTKVNDPANVAMADVQLGCDAFRKWSGDGQAFGVNLRQLAALVDRLDGDEITLEFDPGTGKLDLVSGHYRYTHACLDPDNLREEPTIPDMDLNFEADLAAETFRSVIKWVDEFSTHWRVGFDPDDGRFWIEAMETDRSGSVKTDDGVFELDSSELGYITEYGHADSRFSLDYTRDMLEALPTGGMISLRVGEEFPMLLSFDFGGGHGEAQFLQAPRIASD